MPVAIRGATSEDDETIANIYAAYIENEDPTSFEEIAPDSVEMGRRREKVLAAGFSFLVAVDESPESRVIGYAYADFFAARSAYRFTATNSIYLHKASRGKGVGTLLMKELLKTIKDRGCSQVVAVTASKEDNPGTHRLHEKFGFVQVGFLPDIGMKNGKWVSRAYLQLDLRDASQIASKLAQLEGPGPISEADKRDGVAVSTTLDSDKAVEVTVRDSTADDSTAIREIYCCYIGNESVATFEEVAPSPQEMSKRQASVQSRGFPYLVATINSTVVGYAYADFFRERSAYRFSATNSVYLHPMHRCKGIGAKLTSEVLRRLQTMGFRQVVARMVCREHNPGTYLMHKSLGFQSCAYFSGVGFKNGKWLDVEETRLDLEDFSPN